jgi:nucleoside-diphosphate-sugar epimerase
MKIAIAGASGFLGSQFLDFMNRRNGGYQITAMVRRHDFDFEATFPAVHFALCDLRNPWQIERALQGIEVVINLSGNSSSHDEFEMAIDNYYSVVNLFKSAKVCGVAKIIHTSSIYATALPETAYGKSKKMADDFIRKFEGVQSIIVRPTWVVSSKADANLKRILKMFRFSPLALLPQTAKTKPIHSSDFFKIVEHFVVECRSENKELDVCGNFEVTIDQYYKALMKNLGKKKLILVVPSGFILACAEVGRTILPFLNERIRKFEESLKSQLIDRIPMSNDALCILKELESPLSIRINS